jgi:hypothetical protein
MSQVSELESWANMNAMTSFRSVSRMLPMLSVVVLALTSCWNEDDASGRSCGSDYGGCPSGYSCEFPEGSSEPVCMKKTVAGLGEECGTSLVACEPGLRCQLAPAECNYPFLSHAPFLEASGTSSSLCLPPVKLGGCCSRGAAHCESGLVCISTSLSEPFRCAAAPQSHAYCVYEDDDELSNCAAGEVCLGMVWGGCFPEHYSGQCVDEGPASPGQLCRWDTECPLGGMCARAVVACPECESGSYPAQVCVEWRGKWFPCDQYSYGDQCKEGLVCISETEAGLCKKYGYPESPPVYDHVCWDAPDGKSSDGAGSD